MAAPDAGAAATAAFAGAGDVWPVRPEVIMPKTDMRMKSVMIRVRSMGTGAPEPSPGRDDPLAGPAWPGRRAINL
jgi:hypothetical protein